jgi:hypothetical protein
MKFVNVAKFYKADVLILGGDLTGKMIVPIVELSDGSFRTVLLGENYAFRSEDELSQTINKISAVGFYPYLTSQEEMADLDASNEKVNALFKKLMIESVKKWVGLAEERLKGTGVKCFINAGNDDAFEVDSVLENSQYVIHPEGKVVSIDDEHEMISCGFSNVTPWRCPRDISEEELAAKIGEMAQKVEDMEKCIFNIHCPPVGTGIDQAPRLDKELKPTLAPGGQPEMMSVGSTAVRESIEKYQPMLGLHGHIHELKGTFKLGKTLCINPGSEYTEGILRGFLADISEKGFRDYLFTAG